MHCLLSSSSSICKYASEKLTFENNLPSARNANRSSVDGNGYQSACIEVFRVRRKSPHVRTVFFRLPS